MNEPWYRKLFRRDPVADLEPGQPAEDREDRDAQFGLGLKYANGTGLAQDYVQAAEWYRKAATQSHPLAQFNLGIMYSNGQGMPRDDAAAMMWIRKAADQGDAAAQFNLGVRHQRASVGTLPVNASESKIEAYKWLQLASAQGYHGSASACERVSLTMTHENVTDGNRRVADFLAGQVK